MLFSLLIQTRSRILFDVFCLLFQTFVSDFWFDFWTHHCTVTYAYYENFELVWMRIYSAFLCVRRTKKTRMKRILMISSLRKTCPNLAALWNLTNLLLITLTACFFTGSEVIERINFFLLKNKLRKPCPHTYVLVPRLITDQKVFKNFLQ